MVSVEHENHVDHVLRVWKEIKREAKVPESMRKCLCFFMCFLKHVEQNIVSRGFIDSHVEDLVSVEELVL